MSTVKLTVRQIMNLDLWDKVCEYKDWNPYILNEGLITEDEIVEFDDKFEKPEEEIMLFSEEELMDIEDKLYMMKDEEILLITERLIKSQLQYEKRIKGLIENIKGGN